LRGEGVDNGVEWMTIYDGNDVDVDVDVDDLHEHGMEVLYECHVLQVLYTPFHILVRF
jgi:hypothetical protein